MIKSQSELERPFGPFDMPPELTKSCRAILDAKNDIVKLVAFFAEPDWMSKVLQHGHNLRVLFENYWSVIQSRSRNCSDMEHELIYRDLRLAHANLSAVLDSGGQMPSALASDLIREAFALFERTSNYAQVLARRSAALENTVPHNDAPVIDFLSRRDRTL